MKRIFRILFALMLFTYVDNVSAFSVSSSSKAITKGDSVKVYVNAKGEIGKFKVTSSNSSILSGGTGGEWIEDENKVYTFKSGNLGQATITVTAIDVASKNGSPVSGSKSITISVNKPREKSTNNNLKGLSVEGYNLNEDFNKDKLEYSVDINDFVEKININASKEDNYASIDGIGEKDVIEGVNRFEITVTSETGSSKVYILNVNVKDNNPIVKEIDNKTYNVVKSNKALPEIEKFTSNEIELDNIKIPCLVSDELKLTLVGLNDGNGNIYLYEYKDNEIGKEYTNLVGKGINILYKDLEEEIEGYTKKEVKINNKIYNVYQDSNEDYFIIKGINLDTNKENIYQYNISEGTIQIFNKDLVNKYNKLDKTKKDIQKKYFIIIISLGIICFIELIVMIILLLKKNKHKDKKINKDDFFKEEKKEEVISKEIKVVDEKKNEIKKKIDNKNSDIDEKLLDLVDEEISKLDETDEFKEIKEIDVLNEIEKEKREEKLEKKRRRSH